VNSDVQAADDEAQRKLRNVALAGYALQALFFVAGISAIVAVVLAYIKRDDARGTWLESHFRWQIGTFWWGLLWGIVGGVLMLVLIGWAVLFADMVWIIYRIAKGWLNLNDGKPIAN
jgi:uncharacterized membrane protein